MAHLVGLRFDASLGKAWPPKDAGELLVELDLTATEGPLRCSHTGGDVWCLPGGSSSMAAAAAAAAVGAAGPAAAAAASGVPPVPVPMKCNAWDSKGRNPSMNVYVHLYPPGGANASGGSDEAPPRCKLGVLIQHALPKLAARVGGYGQVALDWVTWMADSSGSGAPAPGSISSFGMPNPAHWLLLQELAKQKETGAGTTSGRQPQPDSSEDLALKRAKETLVAAASYFGPEAVAKVNRLTVRKLYQREYHFFDTDGKDVADSRRHALEWAVGLNEVEEVLSRNPEARAKLNERLAVPPGAGSGAGYTFGNAARKRVRVTGSSTGRRVLLSAGSSFFARAGSTSGDAAMEAAVAATLAGAAPAASVMQSVAEPQRLQPDDGAVQQQHRPQLLQQHQEQQQQQHLMSYLLQVRSQQQQQQQQQHVQQPAQQQQTALVLQPQPVLAPPATGAAPQAQQLTSVPEHQPVQQGGAAQQTFDASLPMTGPDGFLPSQLLFDSHLQAAPSWLAGEMLCPPHATAPADSSRTPSSEVEQPSPVRSDPPAQRERRRDARSPQRQQQRRQKPQQEQPTLCHLQPQQQQPQQLPQQHPLPHGGLLPPPQPQLQQQLQPPLAAEQAGRLEVLPAAKRPRLHLQQPSPTPAGPVPAPRLPLLMLSQPPTQAAATAVPQNSTTEEVVPLDAVLEAWEAHDRVNRQLSEAQHQLERQQQEIAVLQRQLASAAAGGATPSSPTAAPVAAAAAAAVQAQLADLQSVLPHRVRVELAQLLQQRAELQQQAGSISEISCRAVEQALAAYAACLAGSSTVAQSTYSKPSSILQK